MRMRCISIVISCLFGALAIQSAEAQKLLRWQFRHGQKLQLELEQDVTMTTAAMGNMQSSAEMGMTLTWQVMGVETDTAQIEQTIDRIRMKMEFPGSALLQFDSAEKAPENTMAKHMASSVAPLIGTRFLQRMSTAGEITNVELTTSSAEALRKAAPAAHLDESFSHEGLVSLIRQAGLALPKQPVREGDSWTSSYEIESPVGMLTTESTFTYRGTEQVNGQALERIDLSIEVSFGESENAMGLQASVAEQENSGRIYFDATRGQFVKSEVNQRLAIETRMGETNHRQELRTSLRMNISEVMEVASAN